MSGVDIRVPTLRERRADILELAHYFLERHRVGRPLQLTATAADAMVAYDWPGNVRELERMMERAVTLAQSDVIELDDLPPTIRDGYSSVIAPSLKRNDTLRMWACRYVRLVLERCGGNKRAASRALGISHHTLRTYLRSPFYEATAETMPPVAESLVGEEPLEDTESTEEAGGV